MAGELTIIVVVKLVRFSVFAFGDREVVYGDGLVLTLFLFLWVPVIVVIAFGVLLEPLFKLPAFHVPLNYI